MTGVAGADGAVLGPLTGLSAIEIGSSVAVRFCGRILADLGAEVRRVRLDEHPGTGGAAFFDAGKPLLDLDVETPAGYAAFAEAVRGVGAVIESRWPASTDPQRARRRLLEESPGLRVVSLSNFGRRGPMAHLDGSEILAWARSGYMSVTGDPQRQPLMVPNQGAVQAAVNGVLCLLASLLTVDASAEERWIDVSIQECLAYHLAGAVADAALAGVKVGRVGNRVAVAGGGGHNYTAIHRCLDGYVLCTVTTGEPVRQMLAMMGRPAGPQTEHLESRPGSHFSELDDLCGDWVAGRTRSDVVAESTRAGLHWAAVESPLEVLASPHLKSRGYFIEGEESVRPRHPFRMSLAPTGHPSGPPSPTKGLPLAGATVVEISTMVAGPYAGALLADLGATVVKVEPYGGDILRRSTAGSKRPWWFHECNRQKASVCLDLSQPGDLAALHTLVAGADAVLHNLRPGVAEKLGFDAATLRRVKPDLTVVQVSAFGATGPDGARKGTNSTVDAASGLAAVTGYRDGLPMRPGNIYCDMTAALYATVAVLAGLYARRQGLGSSTDLAMLEVAAYGLGDVLATSSETGHDPVRHGDESPHHAPHGCYPCQGGGWVVISVEDETQWRALSSLMADAVPATFDDAHARRDRVVELDEYLARWSAGWSRDELVAVLQAAGVPAAPVLGPEELIDDEQLTHRGYFGWLDAGADGRVPVPQLAVLRGSDRAPATRRGAPALDEQGPRLRAPSISVTQA